jgi:hypothetical protein
LTNEFDINSEEDRVAVHEAGHAVCGYILGGTIHWIAIGTVGVEKYADENTDTMGSTRCEFAKPWLTREMTNDEATIARLVFCANSIRQAYAGVIAEEIVFGRWPTEGHAGDFALITTLFQQAFASCYLNFNNAIANPFDMYLQSQTRLLLSDTAVINAVKKIALVLRERKRIEGEEAISLLKSALPQINLRNHRKTTHATVE